MNFLGFEISKKSDSPKVEKTSEVLKKIVQAPEDDGAFITGEGSWRTVYADGKNEEGRLLSDRQQIINYRRAAEYPECDTAINIIVDEAINTSSESDPVALNIKEDSAFGEKTREKIQEKFQDVLEAMNFTHEGYNLFKRWYVDGRIYMVMIQDDSTKGIKEVRFVDPTKIRKIREVKEVKDSVSGVMYQETVNEYFLYTDYDFSLGTFVSVNLSQGNTLTGVKLHADSVVYVPSGYSDTTGKKVYSYLQKALRQVNQLRKTEDAVVIYRLSRAPERRIFYVDVGNLSGGKADKLMKDVMARYKNKMVYDASSGDVVNQKDHQSMMEDFFLPRREGGKGTEISTLPSGDNLGQIDDVIYFQRKLYRSLNVPLARLEQDNAFSFGRSSEISREEIGLQKFIEKLQRQFSKVLMQVLRAELILTKVVDEREWVKLERLIAFEFVKDNHFSELKEMEVLEQRMTAMQTIDEYIGKYYSIEWVKKHILQQSDSEIEEMRKQIEKEKKEGLYEDPDDEF